MLDNALSPIKAHIMSFDGIHTHDVLKNEERPDLYGKTVLAGHYHVVDLKIMVPIQPNEVNKHADI